MFVCAAIPLNCCLPFFFYPFLPAVLKEAVRSGKTGVVERALRSGFDVELTDGIQGVTLLMCAAMAGQDATLHQLLQSGARVNIAQRNGATALMLAAEEVSWRVVVVARV